MNSEVLTVPQLMEWLQVGKKWVANNVARIPGAFKAGRSWRFERAAIEKQRLTTGKVLLPSRKK